jgi:hypothetical protein
MMRVVIAFFALALVPASALAQKRDMPRGWGYGFGAIGSSSGDFGHTTVHVGAGGEGLFYKGLGAGAEIGYLAPTRSLGDGFGVASVNVAYHFVKPGRKLVPFVTGGYSLLFRNGSSSGGNIGGGVQYWMKDRVALRFEFRDHIISSDSPHFYGFRVGLAFR